MVKDFMGKQQCFPLMYARVNIVLCDRGEMPHRKACALLSTPPQNGYILLRSQVFLQNCDIIRM